MTTPTTTGPRLTLPDGTIVPVEVASTVGKRGKGLLGRDGCDGIMFVPKCRGIHTIGMRFPIDVAFCDADNIIMDIVTIARNRLGNYRIHARSVLEAEAGSFARWGIAAGDRIDIQA